ncbi:MAG: hypothetical protein WAM78_04535 [Candidatus Sulfotelmatobacter sp.]
MRIQIEVDENGTQLLDSIKQATGVTTYKDIFNNGITLFEWAIRQRIEGRVIASLDERTKRYKEMTMPALEDAVRRAASKSAQLATAERG